MSGTAKPPKVRNTKISNKRQDDAAYVIGRLKKEKQFKLAEQVISGGGSQEIRGDVDTTAYLIDHKSGKVWKIGQDGKWTYDVFFVSICK